MRKSLKSILVWQMILLLNTMGFTQVGIGTTNVDPSAKLQIDANNKGFLPPRMTSSQRDAINSPSTGLIIFNTTTNGLEVFSNGVWNKLAFAGSNTDITAMNGLTSQKLITTVAGPINLSSYAAGDVVYEQSTGSFFFFKTRSPQSSSAFGNTSGNYSIFDFGRAVMRIRPNATTYISSITLSMSNPITNGIISLFSGLSACAPSCGMFPDRNVATVDPATLLGSSTATTGSGDVTFTFSSPIAVTANTDYYLTFTSDCTPGLSVGVKTGADAVDANFAISYGSCSIDQGIPALKINYAPTSVTL